MSVVARSRWLAAPVAVAVVSGGLVAWSAPAGAVGTGVFATARVTVVSALASGPDVTSVEYDPTNITAIGSQATTSAITISVGGGTGKRSFYLDLHAASGSTFRTGSTSLGDSGTGDEVAENTSYERVAYTILDLASSGDAITRLDLQFTALQGTSDSDGALLYGEVSLGEPQPTTGIVTGARSVAWPQTPVGTVAPGRLPLWIRNTGSTTVSVGKPALTGADPGDFTVAANTCGSTLAAHAACSQTVLFAPRAAGARTASLGVPVGGTTVSTALSGTGPAGRTLVRITGSAGDWVAQGRSYLVTDAQSPLVLQPSASDSFLGAFQDSQAQWSWTIRTNDELTPGVHPIDDDLFFSLGGWGRGCTLTSGSVNVVQYAYANGQPEHVDLTFTGSCGAGAGDTISGELAYRATTTPGATSAAYLVRSGAAVHAGSSIVDDPGESPVRLAVTTAGRAVLSAGSATLWSSPVAAVAADDRLAVLGNGQLALIRTNGNVLWATPAAGPGAFAVVQTDGNLVLYTSAYVPIWATNTHQAP